MDMRDTGLKGKWSPGKPILGHTDSATVMFDFDDVPFKTVKYWAFRTMKRFRLRGFLVLRSSRKHYHIIFDRTVDWTENMAIVAWVCRESKHQGLLKWFLLQCIKKEATLRMSPKGKKPSPRIIYRYGSQDLEIKNYLRQRRKIRQISKLIERQSEGELGAML
jgi:hypothetical protein